MKKRLLMVVQIASAIIAVITGICLLTIYTKDYRSIEYWEHIKELKEQSAGFDGQDILPSLQALYDENPDIVGWLKIEGGHIDFPVMQTRDDPEYYLRRNFDKEDYSRGVPFADYRCDIVPYQGFNTIIYGHYTDSDDMFRWMLNYSSPKWYSEHKYIQFDTLTGEGTYEIVAAFYFDGADAKLLKVDEWDEGKEQAFEVYNYIDVRTADDFKAFKNHLEEMSKYETSRELTMDSPIITLICCAPYAYSKIEETGRFVVVAQRIK